MSWGSDIGAHEVAMLAFHCRHCDINEVVDAASHVVETKVRHHIELHDYAWTNWMILDLRELNAAQWDAIGRRFPGAKRG